MIYLHYKHFIHSILVRTRVTKSKRTRVCLCMSIYRSCGRNKVQFPLEYKNDRFCHAIIFFAFVGLFLRIWIQEESLFGSRFGLLELHIMVKIKLRCLRDSEQKCWNYWKFMKAKNKQKLWCSRDDVKTYF